MDYEQQTTMSNQTVGQAGDSSDGPSKTMSWGDLAAGDCHQTGGVLTFVSDGTGTWQCTTWTDHTHSGDIWHSDFQVVDGSGALLFPLGTFDSPRMNDDGSSTYWTQQFTYEPTLYDQIASANQTYSC